MIYFFLNRRRSVEHIALVVQSCSLQRGRRDEIKARGLSCALGGGATIVLLLVLVTHWTTNRVAAVAEDALDRYATTSCSR